MCDIPTPATILPTPAAYCAGCRKCQLFLKEKKVVDSTQKVVITNDGVPTPLPIEEVVVAADHLAAIRAEVKQLKENSIEAALALDELSNKYAIAQQALAERTTEFKIANHKKNYISVLKLLTVAEKFDGFAKGGYVRNVVSHAVRHQFEKCVDGEKLTLVFEQQEMADSFLGNCSRFLFFSLIGINVLNQGYISYTLHDAVGDTVCEVRIIVDPNFGWESLSEGAIFKASNKTIIVPGLSLSTFFSDCDQNIFRFSDKGYNELIRLVVSPDQKYANYIHRLFNLGEEYKLIHDSIRLEIYSDRLVPKHYHDDNVKYSLKSLSGTTFVEVQL